MDEVNLVKSMEAVFQDGQKALEINLLHSLQGILYSRFQNLESRMLEIAQQNQQIILLINHLKRSRNSDSSSDYESPEFESTEHFQGRKSCDKNILKLRSSLRQADQTVLGCPEQQMPEDSNEQETALDVHHFSILQRLSDITIDSTMLPSQAQEGPQVPGGLTGITNSAALLKNQGICSQFKKQPDTPRRSVDFAPSKYDVGIIAADLPNPAPAPTEQDFSTECHLQPMVQPRAASEPGLRRLPTAGTAGATAAEAARPSGRTRLRGPW